MTKKLFIKSLDQISIEFILSSFVVSLSVSKLLWFEKMGGSNTFAAYVTVRTDFSPLFIGTF